MIEWMNHWKNKPKPWKAGCLAALMVLTVFGSVNAAASGPAQPAVSIGSMPETLVPIGHTIGIKLFSEGVLVVGLSELESDDGTVTPAKDCGLQVGDLILQVNGTDVESTEHFQSLVQQAAGKAIKLQVRRNGRSMQMEASCAAGSDGVWRLGAWIRDSLAGIGTMTFYDPDTGVFGALGHGINDVDTAVLMPLDVGSIMDSTVKAVKRGTAGDPGELKGSFNLTEDRGTLYANTDCGVFGTMDACKMTSGQALPVAQPEEVALGAATILSNISGDAVEEYQIEITKICNLMSATQNFVVRVTDPRLLEATGGIVQGMSGSPILQHAKLIGAVAHVTVDDPTSGYGICIANMLQQAYCMTDRKVS